MHKYSKMNKEDLKYLKRIDKKVSKDVKEIFDEASGISYGFNIEGPKRIVYLGHSDDLAQLLNGDYVIVKNYSVLKEESD